MGVAENIRRRRLELNMSQQELAQAIGYRSRSTIAKIESGENSVPEIKYTRFARALHTTVAYLKTGTAGGASGEHILRSGEGMPTKNAVIVLAGGDAADNTQNIPNQFINVLGKPVIIYCLEAYERHPAIDDIYIVCLRDWEGIITAYAQQYGITKLREVIFSGNTGILSLRNGIESIKDRYGGDDIVIIQESTRPLVTEEDISKLLNACHRNGSAVTCEPMKEYVQFELDKEDIDSSRSCEYLDRERIVSVQSPEAYRLGTVLEVFASADSGSHVYNESCFAMLLYHMGYRLQFHEGNCYNIKIVRQEDMTILGALLRERY